MYYKTLQLIQNLGKQAQEGKQLSWMNKPTTVALPFNVSCIKRFASLQPMDRVDSDSLDALRTDLISHSDEKTAKQLNVLEWACLMESKDANLAPGTLYAMAKIFSDLWSESFEELYYTVPENERKEAFIKRYLEIWKKDPTYSEDDFAKKLMAFSHGAAGRERKSHPKLFDLLKVITLKSNATVYPDYDVGKVVFKLPAGDLVAEQDKIAGMFKEGLQGLAEKAGDKLPFGMFSLLEKYFSFEGVLGLDTALFYAIVKNKYGRELPAQTIFGFEYEQITIDVDENKEQKFGIMIDIKKRLTEIYIDDATQAVINIDPPLLVHSLLYITEENGIVEARLENLTTVNYSKFVATLSTHILKGTKK